MLKILQTTIKEPIKDLYILFVFLHVWLSVCLSVCLFLY